MPGGGGIWYGYDKALAKLAEKHPEINVVPRSSANYQPDYKVVKEFKEFKDGGYSIRLPQGFEAIKDKDDPDIRLMGPKGKWEIRIQPKLLRYDESIQGSGLLNNPHGDYYVLMGEIFRATKNPVLLAQKMHYLPSTTTAIKEIKTPAFAGFYIVGKSDGRRTEIYRLFDQDYWHNVTVTIYDQDLPHGQIQNIIATLKNDEEAASPENADGEPGGTAGRGEGP